MLVLATRARAATAGFLLLAEAEALQQSQAVQPEVEELVEAAALSSLLTWRSDYDV